MTIIRKTNEKNREIEEKGSQEYGEPEDN